MRLKEFTQNIQPTTPEQSRIKNLKLQKDNATKALKIERNKQKISKAQQSLRQINQP